MEHDAYSSRRYEENWSDSVEASKVDAEEISELKEAYALLFKDNGLLRQGQADFRRECGDTDAILRMLGLDPFRCRTDGGSLRLKMISGALEHRDVTRQRETQQAERERCARLCEGMGFGATPADYAWTIRTDWASDDESATSAPLT